MALAHPAGGQALLQQGADVGKAALTPVAHLLQQGLGVGRQTRLQGGDVVAHGLEHGGGRAVDPVRRGHRRPLVEAGQVQRQGIQLAAVDGAVGQGRG